MKKIIKSFTQVLTTVLLISSVNKVSAQEITIEGLTWSTKNLDVSTFRNGDVIPEVKSNEEWAKAGEEGTPAWCYFENDAANGKKYGKLYNFHAVVDARGLAPEGWHVATYYEWKALNDHFGGADFASKKLKAVAGWIENENGTNESGLNAIPSGHRDFDCSFYGAGSLALFWTATEEDGAWYKIIGDNSTSYLDSRNPTFGMAVRCVKD